MTHPLADRLDEGEILYSALGSDAHDNRVVACSAGAVEVAYPVAYLVGASLTWIVPTPLVGLAPMPRPETARFRRWARAIPPSPDPEMSDAAALLVDDGLLPTEQLVVVACALRNAGVRRLTVAAPWLRPDALAALRSVADRVYPPRQRPEPEWYGEAADPSRAAGLLADVAARDTRERDFSRPSAVVAPPGLAAFLLRGLLVPYHHVRAGGTMDDRIDRGAERLESHGRVWAVEELYCPQPACNCDQILIEFNALGVTTAAFAARIHSDGRLVRLERLEGLTKGDAAGIVERWRATRHDAAVSRSRHAEVKAWAVAVS